VASVKGRRKGSGAFDRLDEADLKRVTASDRRAIQFAVSANRRTRKWHEAKVDAGFGPHCCGHCRAEPCGSMWPHGACCHKCTHLPMPRWRLTHVIWYRKKPYFVMEVPVRRPGERTETERKAMEEDADGPEPTDEQRYGVQRSEKLGSLSDAVYYRWDGVCQWTRRARTHYFLGVRASPAEFLRSLPNAEELREFAPRERPPNPFEEGIVERPADEVGEPFSDRVEMPAEDSAGETGKLYVKDGLYLEDVEEIGSKDPAVRRALARRRGLRVEMEDGDG